MLLPLPRYLKEARNIDSLPPGEGTIINTGPLALRKVRAMGISDGVGGLAGRTCDMYFSSKSSRG